jgi:hypothetical protein
MCRGRAQPDQLLGAYQSEGVRAGNTCLTAVSIRKPERVQRACGGVEGPGELIIRNASELVFTQDEFDIDVLGARVVSDAVKVHPRICLSSLELEDPFFALKRPT